MEGQIKVHIVYCSWANDVHVSSTLEDAIDYYLHRLRKNAPVAATEPKLLANLGNPTHMEDDTETRDEMRKAYLGEKYDSTRIDLEYFFEQNDEDTLYFIRMMDFNFKRRKN